jgi:hypothetical protein
VETVFIVAGRPLIPRKVAGETGVRKLRASLRS